MTAGDIYTVAGNGTGGYSGDGGPATSAELFDPAGVAVDGSGNLVIADALNNRVRVVAESTGTFYGVAMTAGDIYTVAGSGTGGQSGDGGPATSAELNFPQGVAVDGSGNLVIADADNNRVRVVADSTGTFYGVAMTGGDIYTVAGIGTGGSSGDGGPATSAELNFPSGVALDGSGNLVIARHRQQPRTSRGRQQRPVLRHPHDRGRHLHGGWQRHWWLLRGRRPRHLGPARWPRRRGRGRFGQPGDRRRLQQPHTRRGRAGGRAVLCWLLWR